MTSIQLYTRTLVLDLDTGPDLGDITLELTACLAESGVTTGVLQVFVAGSTGSVTTIEYQAEAIEALKRAVTCVAPPGRVYAHELAWQENNGHSHVQASLLGPSLSIPVREGRLLLNEFQQVVVINHDNHPRTRKIEVTVIGA